MTTDSAAVDLSILLLPVTGKLLIVPSVVVAEIIKRRELRSVEHAPRWLLGSFQWHDERVPVISFEALNDETPPDAGGGSRLVIMSTLSEQAKKRNYAVLTQGVPHLMRLTPGDVTQTESASCGPAESMRVHVHGQLSAIPDLDYLERHVLEVVFQQ